jgi:hypothetical protein
MRTNTYFVLNMRFTVRFDEREDKVHGALQSQANISGLMRPGQLHLSTLLTLSRPVC